MPRDEGRKWGIFRKQDGALIGANFEGPVEAHNHLEENLSYSSHEVRRYWPHQVREWYLNRRISFVCEGRRLLGRVVSLSTKAGMCEVQVVRDLYEVNVFSFTVRVLD